VVFRDRAADSTAQSEQTIEWDDGRTHSVLDVEMSPESHSFATGRTHTVDAVGHIARFERRNGGAEAGETT
jgi:large subunit ribosomal protein L31